MDDALTLEMAVIFTAMTEAERLQIGWGMWRSAERMLKRIVAHENPHLSAREQQELVARRLAGGN